MYEWTDFETVFGKAAKVLHDQNFLHAISRNRQNLEGKLFFDRILEDIGVHKGDKPYPPKSNPDLRKLFDTIIQASALDHQKQALIYYIVKDGKLLPEDGETFARAVYLPRKYKLLIDGLHHLDHGRPKQALEMLTSPILPSSFPDQILYSLLRDPKVDNALVLAFYVTVQPPLDESKTLNAYFSMLCVTDIFHAYHFSQTRVQSERKVLFQTLIHSALSPKDDQNISNAETLIGLPFTDEELGWFEHFLIHGKGSSYKGSKDSVIMRRIATGRDFADIEAPHRLHGQKIDGVNWGDVVSNLHENKSSDRPR